MSHPISSFVTGHEDLIHDIAYDHYGRLLATCSSDQHIRVFAQNQNGGWTLLKAFKAHEANIFSLAFSPPQYGVIIASCSEDQTVQIFSADYEGINFFRIATLSDSGGPVHQVSFAKHASHGLKIASIGTDARVRVYHAADPSDLKQWHLAFEADVGADKGLASRDFQGDFAVDWCSTGVISTSGGVDRFDNMNSDNMDMTSDMPRIDQLAISESPLEQFVVSAMSRVFVYRRRPSGKPYDYVLREELTGHTDIVRDVSWASSTGAGGRYELIATACKDGWVRIFKLTLKKRRSRLKFSDNVDSATHENDLNNNNVDDNVEYDVELLNQFDDHKSEVWKVSWNYSGTVLSSSGDDGRVRFWKATYKGNFECMAVVSAEQQQVSSSVDGKGE
ncbi:WD40-repeat-containing domain protein [Dipodascopsis uninucleata]